MNATVQFVDGTLRPMDTLSQGVAWDLFQSHLHVEVCQALALHCGWQNVEFLVGVNLLHLKSAQARQLTALVWYARAGELRLVTCGPETAKLLAVLRCDVPVRVVPAVDVPLITRGQAMVFAAKMFANRAFRLLLPRRLRTAEVVRAWVEVSEAMFQEEFTTATILLYPFPLSPFRQFRFIRRCRHEYPRVRFAGLPYRFRDAVAMCLRAKGRDHRMVRAEAGAYREHARELSAKGVKTIYTSDEFEVGAVSLYLAARELGIRSVNCAHGIGLYSPYVAYDEFRVITHCQMDYYARYSPKVRCVLRSTKNTTLSVERTPSDPFNPVVAYIYQNFSHYGNCYEMTAQDRFLRRGIEAAAACNVQFVIKVHPNQTEAEHEALQEQYGVAVVRQFAELAHSHPIFLNIHSTAYYDVLELGPVLTLKEGSLLPETYYGDSVPVLDTARLESVLRELIVPQSWETFWQRQLRGGTVAVNKIGASSTAC